MEKPLTLIKDFGAKGGVGFLLVLASIGIGVTEKINEIAARATADLAEETAVCLRDMYEQQRNSGRSFFRALLSCVIQLASAFVADWWLRFASRTAAPARSSVNCHERFQIYRSQAAFWCDLAPKFYPVRSSP
jgi:hypothetical protein